jgi:MOSC domain-containing protein YiiM
VAVGCEWLGTILEIGDDGAQIEIVKLREGCDRFAGIQSKTDFSRRLGVLARVLTAGEIAVGSEIRVVEPVR